MVAVSEGNLVTHKGGIIGTYKDKHELMPNLIICMPFEDKAALFINNGCIYNNEDNPNKVVPLKKHSGLESVLRQDEHGMFFQTPEFHDLLNAMAKANSANVIETGYEPQGVYDAHFVAYLDSSFRA